ncbi:MAG: AAA family ATPase [Sedimenticola sp.]|nr:AAA family ATPase [Sedimenticola sp.]
MIITDIRAENFLKYSHLELTELPDKGIIAIDGANESGKSSIGEVICFALFGRTFSLGQEELQKLIRWGETTCSTTLRFRINDQSHYKITRMLDRDGNHGVQLAKVGEETQPFARGVVEVDEAIYDVLGYGYDEFIESFYLAQREIIAPQPHSQAVKSMAGLSTLEYVAFEHEQEIEQERQAIAQVGREIAGIDDELNELNLDPQAMLSLESDQQALQANESLLSEKGAALESSFSTYRAMLPKKFAARKAKGRARFFRFLFFVAGLISAISWGLLVRLPENEYSQRLNALITEAYPQWGAQHLPWLLYATAGFGVLFLLLWIRVATKRSKIAGLLEQAEGFANVLESALLHPGSENSPAEGGEVSDSSLRQEIPSRVRKESISISELEPEVNLLIEEMEQAKERFQQQGIRLGMAIQKERGRVEKGNKLDEIKRGFLAQIAEHDRRITQRERSLELLAGATRHLSQRFNRDLGDSVRKTLPIFTDNNYEHLQIDDDLTVRVFSSQKRDFMDLEEISSGTQRQIMLAVRLALSQALIKRTEGGRQFVFLDEPFAFFDQGRTRNALRMLPKLDESISQIWIVAQDFPDGEAFALSLACDKQRSELVAAG